jgi:tetratricopeptide (TPR) repeat protein
MNGNAKVYGAIGFLLLLLLPSAARAGLYYSGEQYAELPSRFRGFLIDHRALRTAAVERPGNLPASPLRDDYFAAAEKLEKLAKTRVLTADETADLGAVYVRLGKLDKALAVLVPAARKTEHFRLAANLGTAFQLSGDLDRAADYLTEAVRLAPEKLKPFEQYHLKLVRLRMKEGLTAKVVAVDDLFGVKYDGGPGKMADTERKKLPDDAVAIVQQLALWLPSDGRLLWQLGELANANGDVRMAAAMLEGCVTEFGMGAADLRKRRQLLRAEVEEMAKKPELDQHKIAFKGKSPRPLVKAFDESTLPAVKADAANPLPWPVLTATTTDAKGRNVFLKYLEQLDGKTVTLMGFMQPVRDELAVTGFLMLEYPVGCWFCETPEATGLVSIELKAGKTVDFKKGLVKVTGTLKLNRTDPEGYLFTVTEARVGEAD